ncbi:hypothetical protein [Streptomyces sp. Je 1-369]|uniref:hypothetical protein n=1 Tax=Streptomyces sp. Je 1-369 TaxID=2966192 RepID=UPI002285AF5B|nr:hypothetical protein [Streptomyces sp. Je 1-369]WAL93950.1 hypothetical protein NOO62_05225 [Streptomyces sp. Je 1-369]
MTHYLRRARGLTAGATLSSGTAAYLATTNTPLWAVPVVYVAAVLAWSAQRDYGNHRRVLVEHEQARRAACQGADPLVPCCSVWRHSGGTVHGPDCTLPPDTEPDPTAELNSACCAEGFVSRGADHEDTCPTRTPRSNAA